MNTILNKVKLLLGISDTSKDSLLMLLIDNAEEFIINYIHSDDLDDLDASIVDIVIYRYNRMGTEGLNSESYSGVSYSYSDLPDFILAPLKARRKIKVL